MIDITLCDCDENSLKKVYKLINTIADSNNIKVNCQGYNKAETLLFDIEDNKNRSNIFILDIIFEKINGIEVAKEIKKINPNAKIIFLTESREYVFDAFDVMPLNYFLKDDFNEKKFSEVILGAIKDDTRENNIFSFEVRKQLNQVNVRDIISLEVRKRIIVMNCWPDKVYEFYSSMENLERELDNITNLVRVHRSFIVNLDYIQGLKGRNIILFDNKIIPLGVRYGIDFKKIYIDYSVNKVKLVNS